MKKEKKFLQLSPKKTWVATVLLFLFALMGIHLMCQMIGTLEFNRWRFFSYFHFPTIFLLNLLPVALMMFLFYFLFNRTWISFLLTGTIAMGMEYVNYFKVAYRGDPFVVEDIFLVSEAANVVVELNVEIPTWFWFSIFLLIAGTVVLFFLGRGKLPKRLWWVRVAGALACVAFGFLSWKLWYTDMELYNVQLNYADFSGSRDSEYQASHGFFWSFMRSVYLAIPTPPEGYTDQEAEALLGAFEDTPIPEEERINLVAVMFESFSDFSTLEGIEFEQDPYEDFHRLQQECYHGSLIADTIGGGTVNTERAFLTGLSFPQPSYRVPTSSYVHYLKSLGYTAEGGHPGNDWFYNRRNVNAYLGFDSYRFIENYYEALSPAKPHADDNVVLPDVRKTYEEKAALETPYFSFTVTFQNHTPYIAQYLVGEEYVKQGEMSVENYYQLNNYLHGVHDTGRQMAAFVDSFRDDEEPVVLILFGDHKPTLGESNACYAQLGLDIAETSNDGCRNLYEAPYLFWANDAAKEILGDRFHGEGRTLSPCFLMAELFDVCGWEGPAWMQYQRVFREEVSVMQKDTMYRYDGVLHYALPDDVVRRMREYDRVEYYMRHELYAYSFEE